MLTALTMLKGMREQSPEFAARNKTEETLAMRGRPDLLPLVISEQRPGTAHPLAWTEQGAGVFTDLIPPNLVNHFLPQGAYFVKHDQSSRENLCYAHNDIPNHTSCSNTVCRSSGF